MSENEKNTASPIRKQNMRAVPPWGMDRWGGGGCAKPPLGKSKEAQIYLPMGVLPRERI